MWCATRLRSLPAPTLVSQPVGPLQKESHCWRRCCPACGTELRAVVGPAGAAQPFSELLPAPSAAEQTREVARACAAALTDGGWETSHVEEMIALLRVEMGEERANECADQVSTCEAAPLQAASAGRRGLARDRGSAVSVWSTVVCLCFPRWRGRCRCCGSCRLTRRRSRRRCPCSRPWQQFAPRAPPPTRRPRTRHRIISTLVRTRVAPCAARRRSEKRASGTRGRASLCLRVENHLSRITAPPLPAAFRDWIIGRVLPGAMGTGPRVRQRRTLVGEAARGRSCDRPHRVPRDCACCPTAV